MKISPWSSTAFIHCLVRQHGSLQLACFLLSTTSPIFGCPLSGTWIFHTLFTTLFHLFTSLPSAQINPLNVPLHTWYVFLFKIPSKPLVAALVLLGGCGIICELKTKTW